MGYAITRYLTGQDIKSYVLAPKWDGPPIQHYKVRKGDTLWDICTKFFGDPYVWPRIWSSVKWRISMAPKGHSAAQPPHPAQAASMKFGSRPAFLSAGSTA